MVPRLCGAKWVLFALGTELPQRATRPEPRRTGGCIVDAPVFPVAKSREGCYRAAKYV